VQAKCRLHSVTVCSPLKLKHIAFKRLVEIPNLPVFFNISKCKNNPRYLRCLAKMTFNMSRLGMCMVTIGHFIIVNISPGGNWRGARAQEGRVGQLPPLVPTMATKMKLLCMSVVPFQRFAVGLIGHRKLVG